jgi:hypothetical protein
VEPARKTLPTTDLTSPIQTCTNPSGQIQDCAPFTLQSDDVSAKCAFATPADLEGEDCEGTNEGLPYSVPIQYGPEPATHYPVYGVDSKATSLPASAKPSTFSKPTMTYSPASIPTTDAPVAAQGGIIGADTVVSSAPAAPAATSSHQNCYTTWITKGYEVIEMVIIETDITVTATGPAPSGYVAPTAALSSSVAAASAPVYEAPKAAASSVPAAPAAPAYKHKRHMEKHQKRWF